MSEPVAPFTPEIVAAVTSHMNSDHPEDNVLIVRALGGIADATDATLTDISPAGATFRASVEGGDQEVVVPWAVEVTERATIRQEVVRMYHESCTILGVEPRQAGEH